ncbi:DEAD/DEAH box helicase family protein [Mucilaginibacter hurinus]|uniref:DEAD/DEAH box helicase family protein n=1 Tax=Mucilaginibacter hurinus TaxID=2201324 RepID=UPI0018F3AB24|nr:DEAD/DEAH box helicase family protein [Mucilaginibacter hurinus]
MKENLKFPPRPYQIEAFARFFYYLTDYKKRAKPSQLLFHMATGSGKTLIMAGAMLELYRLGYRNFLFFVNTDTIIRKTKENFLNPVSSKYLFKDRINIDGEQVGIREVENFESVSENSINILFSTIQGLHSQLNNPHENSVTFDDFTDKKLVLISDEAHHVNALTKKKLVGEEAEINNTWEVTITRIFNSNPENVMLEFTATLELSHPMIASKYNSKLLYDYALAKFRQDGFSKEVKTIQIDIEAIDRALVGVIISQYKKKIFSKYGILVKPVIMMKSDSVASSTQTEIEFNKTIRNFNAGNINRLRSINNDTLNQAFLYFESLGISDSNLIDEIKEDFSEDKVISVNSKNDSDQKQLIINSLEDKQNEYRVVFAVDKLNEGWDVLNLFDIIRLYETRDKGGKTTTQEAQLIGRGARYFPFKLNDSDEADKRKFDADIEHDLRIGETLHYHCFNEPRYISELYAALREIGIVPNEKTEVQLELKDEFKKTQFYKTGFILLNKKVENDPKIYGEYQEPILRHYFTYNIRTAENRESLIFEEGSVAESQHIYKATQSYELITFDKAIIRKAIAKLPFFQFNRITRFFPSLKSIDDFIEKSKYLGGIKVDVTGLAKDVKNLTPKVKLDICIDILTAISEEVYQRFGEFKGTKTFSREPIRSIFKDKKLYFALNEQSDKEAGRATMRGDIDPKYYVNLLANDWYAFKENYGTSEEKFLVKFLDSQMQELQKRFNDIYLLRNEKFFKLYRFSDGKATEPDYVLFMKERKSNEDLIYQLFIEPKGGHLMAVDSWKEDFLKEIANEAKVELYQNEQFRLIGMPFYNKFEKESQFKDALINVGI